MDGIVNVLKPAGMTSHDVVAKLRKIYKTKKVGHTGTLDPDAIGVLPVCIGQATRLVEYLMEKEKTYRVILNFGEETDTQDSSGQVTLTTEHCQLERQDFLAIIEGFIGEIEQIPPMYSAIKKDGQPLYKLARQGIVVDVMPRKVTIHQIDVLMFNAQSAMLTVRCSKGTYIRTLCQDIGRACHSSAHMSFLMRTQSGQFSIDQAVTLDKLADAANPEEYLVALTVGIKDMPMVTISEEKVKQRINNGLEQSVQGIEAMVDGTTCQALDEQGQLLAIGVSNNGYFKPHKVFKRGE